MDGFIFSIVIITKMLQQLKSFYGNLDLNSSKARTALVIEHEYITESGHQTFIFENFVFLFKVVSANRSICLTLPVGKVKVNKFNLFQLISFSQFKPNSIM